MKPPPASELVHAAMRSLGVSNQTDLAYELRVGYGVRVSQSQVSRWLTGQGPSYEVTVALLDAAGWLGDEPRSNNLAGDVAVETVRRLDLGEKFPPGQLLELSEAVTLAAEQALRYAARLQRAARTAEPNG